MPPAIRSRQRPPWRRRRQPRCDATCWRTPLSVGGDYPAGALPSTSVLFPYGGAPALAVGGSSDVLPNARPPIDPRMHISAQTRVPDAKELEASFRVGLDQAQLVLGERVEVDLAPVPRVRLQAEI